MLHCGNFFCYIDVWLLLDKERSWPLIITTLFSLICFSATLNTFKISVAFVIVSNSSRDSCTKSVFTEILQSNFRLSLYSGKLSTIKLSSMQFLSSISLSATEVCSCPTRKVPLLLIFLFILSNVLIIVSTSFIIKVDCSLSDSAALCNALAPSLHLTSHVLTFFLRDTRFNQVVFISFSTVTQDSSKLCLLALKCSSLTFTL